MTRRQLIAAACAPAVIRAASKKPNFLFLIADDHAGYAMGAGGSRIAHTPNLDRLAREGVRFSRHFCNSPVCTPSRQSLFTGQLPHAAGVTRLMTPLALDKPTLAKQFRKAGYTTAVFGKMHFQRPGDSGLHGFDLCHTEDVLTRQWQRDVTPRALPDGAPVLPPWKPFQDPARIWLNADKLPFGRYDADMRASFQVGMAERYLEQHRHQPFALWVSFMEPHSPFHFPFEYRGRFSPSAFRAPQPGPADAWQIPEVFRTLSPQDKQGIAASYYTSVEFLDRNIGRVLDKLRALDLYGNAVVVYTADHGYLLGEHGRFEKHCGYDEALRVPLVISHPSRLRPRVVNALTEHADLSATIIDMLNLEPLPVQHGLSLRPLLEGGRPLRDHIFSEYLENEEAYIRSDRWKLIYCTGRRARTDGYITAHPTPGPYTRLYDLEADPAEMTDLADQHPSVVTDMKRLMLERFRSTHPDGADGTLDSYLRPRDA